MFAAPSLEKKTTNRSARFEIVKASSPLRMEHVKGLIPKIHSTESRVVIGPSVMLFAGVLCVYISARKFYEPGQLRG